MRILRLSLVGTVSLALLGGPGSTVLAQADESEAEPRARVTFYHTADIHENGVDLTRIAEFVESRKDEDPNVLFVDSGDWFNKGDLTRRRRRTAPALAAWAAPSHWRTRPAHLGGGMNYACLEAVCGFGGGSCPCRRSERSVDGPG